MSVLDALRTATAPCHARLEQVMALDSDRLTLARYAMALRVLLAVRSGWEPELEALHPGSTGPHRLWLAEDLDRIGLDPLPPPPPLGLDWNGAWGLRYVLEGSALGGRVLLRRVGPLGFDGTGGARYLAGHGPSTGPIWKAFLTRLEKAATPDAVPVIVRAAVQAFEALTRYASARFDEGLDARQDLAPPLAAVEDPVMAHTRL